MLATEDEERARAEATLAIVAHRSGATEAALGAFRRAADHAVRAGAVLEEATYFTGLASAATDLGEFGEALTSARRATLLFEHLGRPQDAARAALARAAAYAAAGAAEEAREAAFDAMERASIAGDSRCAAYAELALADVSSETDGLEHARRAMNLLSTATGGDRLCAAARVLVCGGELELELESFDAIARDPEIAVEARFDWWGARARREDGRSGAEQAARIVGELCALLSQRAPTSSRGAALSAGAALAARSGDGESARRLTLAAGEAARELLRRAPPELRGKVANLPWIAAVQSPRKLRSLPEQLSDVETLVRALGRRDNLRQLLDQVLDALVLWTGVERGLLLLRAPGGRLVPRAARNLARRDLTGAQLELSRSLAERALAQREPVVAVDAAGELPEVHESVHALKLRSVLSVPLLARGEALGVVYLDDRVRAARSGRASSPGCAWSRRWRRSRSPMPRIRSCFAVRRGAPNGPRRVWRKSSRGAKRSSIWRSASSRVRAKRATRVLPTTRSSARASRCSAMLRVLDRVTLADVPVLIIGESGSGKELVARAIHANGRRVGPRVRQRELRRDSRGAARVHAVRPHARRVHRRFPPPRGPVRGRRPRHALPRRDRGNEPGHADEALARAGERRGAPDRLGTRRAGSTCA